MPSFTIWLAEFLQWKMDPLKILIFYSKWGFSIAMLLYRRVDHFNCSNCAATLLPGGLGIFGGWLLHGLWKFISVWGAKEMCDTNRHKKLSGNRDT